MKWKGRWRFNNVFDGNHGRTGAATVNASSRVDAEEAIRCKASRELFNTTIMQRYVQVTDLAEIPYS